MENVVTSLTTELSAANLWATVGNVVPLLAVTTIFALGFYLVKRIINKAKKTKGGM